ncbi:MAG: hypothetical protein EPN23_02920 [Verrucomicrobia bacterium]|nr:MAG: hypothetical protein EPN23_02920 [Verrucomicrobiota bacterium]
MRWKILLWLSVFILALLLRLLQLAARPMHTDETVNAYLVGQLLAGEGYHYDPQDRHGPALYVAALPLVRLAGEKTFAALHERTLRLVPVLMGALAVFLFLPLARAVGWSAWTAALLWAVAPLPLYYSRYFIHETGFIAATLVVMAGGLRAALATGVRAVVWTVFAGIGAGLMLAFKETAVLNFAALGLATLVVARPTWRWVQHGLLGAGVAVVVALGFYTWGFTEWQGPVDFVRSFARFAARAGGEGHEKPWWYFLLLLGGGKSGALFLVLAVWGGWLAWRAGDWRGRFVVVYAAVIFVIHSTIPYKTPWLALNFWLPLALLAGWTCAVLHAQRRFIASAFIAAVLLVTLARDVQARVFREPAGDRNPYAYAHTAADVIRLQQRVEAVAEKNPAGRALRIAVVMDDAWPLPWYLRQFSQVGFWRAADDPGSAEVYVTSSDCPEHLHARLQGYTPEFFGLRPNELLLLWTKTENLPQKGTSSTAEK